MLHSHRNTRKNSRRPRGNCVTDLQQSQSLYWSRLSNTSTRILHNVVHHRCRDICNTASQHRRHLTRRLRSTHSSQINLLTKKWTKSRSSLWKPVCRTTARALKRFDLNTHDKTQAVSIASLNLYNSIKQIQHHKNQVSNTPSQCSPSLGRAKPRNNLACSLNRCHL